MASTITILVLAVLLAASDVFRGVECLSDAEAYDLLVPLNALFYDLYNPSTELSRRNVRHRAPSALVATRRNLEKTGHKFLEH